jgi:hypothetical protein
MDFFKSYFFSSPHMTLQVNFDMLRRCLSIVHWLNDEFYDSILTHNLDDCELAEGIDETCIRLQRHFGAINARLFARRMLGAYREWTEFDSEDEHNFHDERDFRPDVIRVGFATYRYLYYVFSIFILVFTYSSIPTLSTRTCVRCSE